MSLIRLAHRYLVRQAMPALAVGYYNRLIDSIADFYLRPLCDELLAAFPSPITILDIGTGTGQLPVMLAVGNPHYRLIGVDLSEACLRAARQRAAQAGVADRVEFIRANLPEASFNPPPVDLVVSTCSLHHWRHPVRLLRAASRLLKPSGEIWIMDDVAKASEAARSDWVQRVEKAASPGWLFRTVFRFESRFLAYSREELETMLAKAGLHLVEFKRRDVFFMAKMSKSRRQSSHFSQL